MPDQLFAFLLPQARVFTKWLIVVLHKMVTVNYPTDVLLRGQFSLGGTHLGWNLRRLDQKDGAGNSVNLATASEFIVTFYRV